ncbi:MAG: GDP-L-fucose synthase [Thermodesulfovibrionales bacterium]|jgi:GDP-L-fucose synthase
MNKESKIFIAGHRGLVGSALVRRFVSEGYTNLLTRTSRELDLTRQADVETFFEKERPEYVLLAAAKVGGILANNTYKAEFIYQNIMIAANVIHSSYRYGVKGLLNLGSSCIYPKHAPQPMKEEYLLTGSLEPTNEPYAIAKISAVKLCRYYNDQYGTNYLSVMPTNLYGPDDNFNLETSHVLPALIRKFHLARLLREKRSGEIERDLERFPAGFHLQNPSDLERLGVTAGYVEIWGSGEPYREFLYVDDLADACIFLMDKYGYKEIGEIINVGVGEDIQIKDIAGLVREITGFEGEIRYDRMKPEGTPRKLLDISGIKALGWTPNTALEAGIRMTYDWYRKTVQDPKRSAQSARG